MKGSVALYLSLQSRGSIMVLKNTKLKTAKKAKDDEFYTRYEDIEKEIVYYKEQLKGKIIYCPCDTRDSNFYKYFKNNFEPLQLKKLIISSLYDNTVVYDGVNENVLSEQNVDCFSDIAKKHFEESDAVITNPPFSTWCQFFAMLLNLHKDFLTLGSITSIGYCASFDALQAHQTFLGYNIVRNFLNDKQAPCVWHTTFKTYKEPLKLTATYVPGKYEEYLNFDAINIAKCTEIPKDYPGPMGVPISFMLKWNPNQFEVLGLAEGCHGTAVGVRPLTPQQKQVFYKAYPTSHDSRGSLYMTEGTSSIKQLFAKIIIRHKNPSSSC